MKKLLIYVGIFSLLFTPLVIETVHAQQDSSGVKLGTLVPMTDVKQIQDCKVDLDKYEKEVDPVKLFKTQKQEYKDAFLACAISTGRIHLWMIPYYVVYLIKFLIGIAGLIAVLFIVIAGFQYVSSGLAEAKENAKKTITNALLGLGVALAAWAVVNLVQYLVTL